MAANGGGSHKFGDPDQGIGLATRVIVYLARLGHHGINDVARVASTQQGMVATLKVHQGSLVRVLQRLHAGNVVSVQRRFVLESNRRMKVYALTDLGESLARDLSRSSGGNDEETLGGDLGVSGPAGFARTR